MLDIKERLWQNGVKANLIAGDKMTIQQIRYFLEVVKTKKFTAAAQNMYVAQSSLSHAIQELEHEIGAPLFVRNKRKDVTLTEYGENFLPYAEQLLSVLSASQKAMKQLKDPYSGTVKIGFYYCVAGNVIPEICQSFYKKYRNNDLFIDVNVYNGDELIDEQLVLGKYDMVISTSEEIRDCHKLKIGTQDIKVFVSSSHHLAAKEVIKIEDLDGEPVIGFQPTSNLDRHIKRMYKKANMILDISYVQDWATQACYVALDYGIALTPSLPIGTSYTKELTLDNPMVRRDLNLFWPSNHKISNAAELVRKFIVDYSSEHIIC